MHVDITLPWALCPPPYSTLHPHTHTPWAWPPALRQLHLRPSCPPQPSGLPPAEPQSAAGAAAEATSGSPAGGGGGGGPFRNASTHPLVHTYIPDRGSARHGQPHPNISPCLHESTLPHFHPSIPGRGSVHRAQPHPCSQSQTLLYTEALN